MPKPPKPARPVLPIALANFLDQREKYKNLAIANLPTWGERLVPVTFLAKPSKSKLEENEADLDEHPHVTVLATLGPEYSAFLVVDLADDVCPVLLWDEGTFHPVAPSLQDFLGKLQKKGTPPRSAPLEKANEKAAALDDAGKHAEAVKVLDKALEGVPGSPDGNVTKEYCRAVYRAFLIRGNAYAALDDRRALTDLATSLRWSEPADIDPTPALMSQVEAMSIQLGDHQAALERWAQIKQEDQFLQAHRYAFYIHKFLGYSYLATGKDALAEQEYEAAFKADPEKRAQAADDLRRYLDRKLPNPDLASKLLTRFEKGRWR